MSRKRNYSWPRRDALIDDVLFDHGLGRDRALGLLEDLTAADADLEEAEEEVKRLRRVLLAIEANDLTEYEHHQPRRSDGLAPSATGGTKWLTPREIARNALDGLAYAEPSTPEDDR